MIGVYDHPAPEESGFISIRLADRDFINRLGERATRERDRLLELASSLLSL